MHGPRQRARADRSDSAASLASPWTTASWPLDRGARSGRGRAAGLDAKQVPRTTRQEAAFAEGLAHPRDLGVERMAGAAGARVLPTIRRSADRARPSRSRGEEGEQAVRAASAHRAGALGRLPAPRQGREPGTPSPNVSTVTSGLRGSCEVGRAASATYTRRDES